MQPIMRQTSVIVCKANCKNVSENWIMHLTAQKITPCLWFDSDAEQAAEFYVSVFKNAKIGRVSRYGKEGFEVHGRKAGTVMTVEFEIEGLTFLALNGGPHFKFNEAVSFQIHCQTQDEVDFFWNRLIEGGNESQCGWLKDKFGLSWQIIPSVLGELLNGKDPERSKRAMEAMLRMDKLDIEQLRQAYDGN
jgi:predicted 3-demethylubiquinone-9 3-methyltransferase (glyoxalase superfamily)